MILYIYFDPLDWLTEMIGLGYETLNSRMTEVLNYCVSYCVNISVLCQLMTLVGYLVFLSYLGTGEASLAMMNSSFL